MLLHSRPATLLMLISLLAQSFLSPFIYFASARTSVPISDRHKEALIAHSQINPALDLSLPTENPLYARIPSSGVKGTANFQTDKEQVDVPLGVWPGDNREFFGEANPAELLPTCNCGANPINSTTGNFWHTFNDLSIPSRGIPLSISRTYNSQAAGVSGPLGYGWTFNYNMFATRGLTRWTMQQENGSITSIDTSGSRNPWVLANITTRSYDQLETFTRTGDQIRHYYRHYTTGGSIYGLDKLDRIVSRNGYTTTLQYEAVPGQQGVDRLASVTDPESRQLIFFYDESSKPTLITRIVDPLGRTLTFTYDSNNNLSTATDIGGKVTTFTYDSNHRLLTMTDPKGGTVTNTYDSNSRVLTQTDPINRLLGFEYSGPLDGAGATTTRMTDTLGLVSIYAYDYRRLESITRNATAPPAERSITTFTYPPPHPYRTEVLSVTDPLNNTWNYTWDNSGNVLSATDPLSRTTGYKYNSTNDLTVITNTLGLTTTLAYDQWGNVTSITRPRTETNQLITTTLTYDPLKPGDVLTVTNPLGKNWGMRYDTYGNLQTATNPLNETSTFRRNSIGWLLSATDPLSHTSTFTYTTYGEPRVITNSLNYTTTYAYDDVGNVLNVTDANFKTITNTYNLNNELTRATRPDGTFSQYGYDAGGRVITQTNGLGQSTLYAYDDIYRRVTVTDPLSRSSIAAYDLVGNTTLITDAMGLTTTLGYDAAYQLRSIDYQSSNTPDVSFAYNNLGMRTVMTDGTGSSLYSYDSLSRPVSVQQGNGRTVTYGYDNGSRLTSIGYPNLGGSGTLTVTRQYNDANRLTGVTDWLNHTNTFGYDLDGKLSGITYGNGVTSTLGYNGGDQLTSITHNNTGGAFLSLSYGRDPVGLLSSANEGAQGTHGYEYDPLYRVAGDQLTAGTNISSTWGYDAATQIVQTTYTPGGGSTATTTRTYDAANQLQSLVEVTGGSTTKNMSFSFNKNGDRTLRTNKLTGVTTTYAYDQASRLHSYNNWQYRYNGDGLRMSKSTALSAEQFTWDVVSGIPLLLQDEQASYIYGPGGMLIEQVNPASDDPVRYYHPDQLGSIRAMTNSAGSVVNTYNYDAYGQRTSTTGTAYNPFGYTGEYTDSESGLIYLRARYYDPSTQQFLTVDPLVGWTEQAYAYVVGSPTNLKDPTGKFWWIVGGAVAGGIIGGGVNLISQVASGQPVEWGQVAAAAGGGAVAGAVGAAFGPLGAAASSWAGGGLLGAGASVTVNAVGSALGGLAGQSLVNVLAPQYQSDPWQSALWSGIGGAIFSRIPIARMGSWSQAWRYEVQTYRPFGWNTGIPTLGEVWNQTKLAVSTFGSNLVGTAGPYLPGAGGGCP